MSLHALLVEDDASFAQVVEVRLNNWKPDLNLTTATSLETARKILQEYNEQFSLVILDQHLPDGMGFTLAEHPALKHSVILAMSADDAPELPALTLRAGAQHFLWKRQVTAPLFIPLLDALLERKEMETQLRVAEAHKTKVDVISVLLATLKHEINNPLGAVMGAAYLLKETEELKPEHIQAIKVIEDSGNRIKHVVQELCKTAELEEVTKAHERVYQVPGDKPWPKKKEEKC